MTQPILSIEQEGEKSILRLRKTPGAPFVVEKALNKRSKPGLESDLSRNDLNRFKETTGLVNIMLQMPE